MADESPELKVRLVADDEIAWYNAVMAAHHSLGVVRAKDQDLRGLPRILAPGQPQPRFDGSVSPCGS